MLIARLREQREQLSAEREATLREAQQWQDLRDTFADQREQELEQRRGQLDEREAKLAGDRANADPHRLGGHDPGE